jgi:hypothetical protein
MAERCEVCGQSYGLTHTCPGRLPTVEVDEWIPPQGFAPGFYLRLAVGVARLQDGAILHASRDVRALYYGATIWVLVNSLTITASMAISFSNARPLTRLTPVLAGIAFFIALVFAAVLTVVQYGASHLIAKFLLDAKGTFLGILQPMLLGSIVAPLALIPIGGTFIAGIWGIAILMRVFEEVDQIERMKAFLIAFAIGAIFWILSFMLIASQR